MACRDGADEVLPKLVPHTHYPEDDQKTLIDGLCIAAACVRAQCVDLLTPLVQNIDGVGRDGQRPLGSACQGAPYRWQVSLATARAKIVTTLLKHKASVHLPMKDSSGLSPLWLASRRGHHEIAQILLDHKVRLYSHQELRNTSRRAAVIHRCHHDVAGRCRTSVEQVVSILGNHTSMDCVVVRARHGGGEWLFYFSIVHFKIDALILTRRTFGCHRMFYCKTEPTSTPETLLAPPRSSWQLSTGDSTYCGSCCNL